jgi:hypothetical protein
LQVSPALAEHFRKLHTYRWVGLLTGTVLLGVSIPTLVWIEKHRDPNRPATTKEDAVALALLGGAVVGGGATIIGVTAWVYLGLYEPASPAHASLGSPYLMMGGRF